MCLEADPRPRRFHCPRRGDGQMSPGAWMRVKLSTTGYCLSDHERRELRLGGRRSTGVGHADRGGFQVSRIAAVAAALDPSTLESP